MSIDTNEYRSNNYINKTNNFQANVDLLILMSSTEGVL